MTKRSRNRANYGESTKKAYESISFTTREPTGHPRSPHSFFASSHEAIFAETPKNITETPTPDETIVATDETATHINKYDIKQVVHHHVNGLCIVTAGEFLPATDITTIQSIRFVAKEATACSNAEKRKRQAKMLKGKSGKKFQNFDAVTPSTVICELVMDNGDIIPLYACVFGTILELNHALAPKILQDDPLLDGFLAVILPSGNFPPKIRFPETNHDDRKEEKQDAKNDEDAGAAADDDEAVTRETKTPRLS